jgi:molecular chaperone DnaK
VLQGEREMAADNVSLGRFELVGIPPAPRGVPQIEVAFEIDTDGVVSVSAKDLGTGRSQQIRVSPSGGLAEEQIQKILAEAAEHAEADRARRGLIDLRNKADGLIYSTERTMEEYAEHVSADDRKALEAALEKARSLLESQDAGALGAAVDELSGLSYQMTEKLYEALGGDASS